MIAVESLTYRYGDGGSDGADDDGGSDSADTGDAGGAPADAVALDDVSLSIPDGQFLVLCGPNGSGKTTLVRQFNALLTPDSGRVLVDGVDAHADPVAARTAVGMVFQDPRDGFVAATVGGDVAFGPENLGLARGEVDRRVADALEAVGLVGREDDRIESLSGGERERLAIAGALAMEPAHLVLDEPFTGLDAPARERVLERLAALHDAGTGVVVVTHDLRPVLPLADRVVCLVDGRVVVDDDPAAACAVLGEYGVAVPNTGGDRIATAGDGAAAAVDNPSAAADDRERR